MTTAATALTEALSHHQAGRLPQAEAIYRKVLARDPANADALHLMGMLAYEAGRHQEALAMIAQAIRLQSDAAPFHNNLGNVLLALGRPYDAALCFTKALALAPEYVEAHINFGNALQSSGLLEEAILHYRRALELNPDSPEAHNNLGNALLAQGMAADAAESFAQALRLKPDYSVALLNLCGAFRSLEQHERAEECCRQAIQLAPSMAEAYCNLGAVLSGQERLVEAEAAALAALGLKPALPEAFAVLSVIHQARHRFGEAEQCARQALALRPGYAEALNNLGNALQEQGRYQEAHESYAAALGTKPNLAEAHYNFGNLMRLDLRLRDAQDCYERAIRLKPNHAKAHWNLAHVLLAAGDLEHGWDEFEWRWKIKGTPARQFRQPLWDGSGLAGRTILLHAEQGLGDAVQFVRYAGLVKAAGGKVVLECPVKLVCLLEDVAGIDAIVASGSPLPDFDVHAPLLSLPRIFRISPLTVPTGVPYIPVPAAFRGKWRQRLAGVEGRKIGLVWAGNPKHAEDGARSLSLGALSPLMGTAGAAWFSLQHSPAASSIPEGSAVTDLGPETEDFRDAAAAIEQLDLVISVDTSMAHLAGALARPVWLLLSFVPDWRWMLVRQDTPWYPTMRLFRQRKRGNWDSVISAVREELDRGLTR